MAALLLSTIMCPHLQIRLASHAQIQSQLPCVPSHHTPTHNPHIFSSLFPCPFIDSPLHSIASRLKVRLPASFQRFCLLFIKGPFQFSSLLFIHYNSIVQPYTTPAPLPILDIKRWQWTWLPLSFSSHFLKIFSHWWWDVSTTRQIDSSIPRISLNDRKRPCEGVYDVYTELILS